MRIISLMLLVAAVALSGCADESEDAAPVAGPEEPQSEGPAPEENPGAPETPSGETPAPVDPDNTTVEPTNSIPVVNFTVDSVEGETPLSVTFAIDATDADGDELFWSLDADEDGVEDVNGTMEDPFAGFTYMQGGIYMANLTVTDGQALVNAFIEIVVTTPEPVTETMSCDVVAGYGVQGLPTVTINGLPVNLGGCSLGEVAGQRVVLEVSPGTSCNISADLDGDGFSDEDVLPGNRYEAGHTFTAFCYFGAAAASNSVLLEVLDA